MSMQPFIIALIFWGSMAMLHANPTHVFFENVLGIKLADVPGESIKMSLYEIQNKDYQAFVEATQRPWPEPYFGREPDHPAVNISWEDAMLFCRWLTQLDRAAGLIIEEQVYRLPTEAEWMQAAGYEKQGVQRFDVEQGMQFPWGGTWPAPSDVGNYAVGLGVDGFAETAPVGSFPPNPHGFFDMGGNAWEWCLDRFEQDPDLRVLKGASWRMDEMSNLTLEAKVGNVARIRLPTYGFRVVLAKKNHE